MSRAFKIFTLSVLTSFKQIIIFSTLCFTSCQAEQKEVPIKNMNNLTETISTKRIEPDLSDFKTPGGNIIKYKRTGEHF
jgi:hypothetical protein